MSNMSYCRFENTYHDLEDCLEALDEKGIEGVEEGAGTREKPYVRDLLQKCIEIAERYSEELDELEG